MVETQRGIVFHVAATDVVVVDVVVAVERTTEGVVVAKIAVVIVVAAELLSSATLRAVEAPFLESSTLAAIETASDGVDVGSRCTFFLIHEGAGEASCLLLLLTLTHVNCRWFFVDAASIWVVKSIRIFHHLRRRH